MAKNISEFHDAVEAMFVERRFGNKANQVVMEEFLPGTEVSITILYDGKFVLPLPDSMDYKQIGEGDTGDNTGGMGVHSPSVAYTDSIRGIVNGGIVAKTVLGLQQECLDYRGVIYIGLMLTKDGPKVLEYNCRFGDPECQALMMRLGKNDTLPLLHACAIGELDKCKRPLDLNRMTDAAVCIALTSKPYPDTPVVGEQIKGLEQAMAHEHVRVFHAGTTIHDGQLLTAGGRVLNVCATGADIEEALARAYAAADEIWWPSKYMRRDIGWRVLGKKV